MLLGSAFRRKGSGMRKTELKSGGHPADAWAVLPPTPQPPRQQWAKGGILEGWVPKGRTGAARRGETGKPNAATAAYCRGECGQAAGHATIVCENNMLDVKLRHAKIAANVRANVVRVAKHGQAVA